MKKRQDRTRGDRPVFADTGGYRTTGGLWVHSPNRENKEGGAPTKFRPRNQNTASATKLQLANVRPWTYNKPFNIGEKSGPVPSNRQENVAS